MKSQSGVHYGNCKVFNRDRNLIFRCSHKKASWYLKRGIAEILCKEPYLTIQLRFEANGPGHIGEQYYLQDKENRCVVCGSFKDLSRHHVVPHVYKKFFPDSFKRYSSYDVVLLCCPCHLFYEKKADIFKSQLAVEFNIPVGSRTIMGDEEKRVNEAIKIAITLQRHSDSLPTVRYNNLYTKLKILIGKTDISGEEISQIACWERKVKKFINHGEAVVRSLDDIQLFIERWRRHFLETMKPNYLSAFWQVDWKGRSKQGEIQSFIL